jgi:predicted membrane-bound spermidine synthase
MRPPGKWLLLLAVMCLLLSGAAGLVYQVVWMRYLSLFLGTTSHAVVLVLVSFMGGLALGNAWLGVWADRVRRPLALYAWLELGIGLCALLFPHYYELAHRAYLSLATGLNPGGQVVLGLKFGFSFSTILVPTLLMGGTLPVMTKLVTRSLAELRARVGLLYFSNSLGAVVGCVLADFWWIPALGLEATVLAGASLNLAVGVAALLVGQALENRGLPRQEGTPGAGSPAPVTFTPAELRLAIAGIGVSGFVAMLYEVVWTRMLALALGSNTHAFSIMLVTFISGIAAGAWVIARWHGLQRDLDAFAWAELALAGTLALSMCFYDLVPYGFARLASNLARRAEVYPLYELLQGLVCFAVMFPPTLCLGMTLPLVSRVATADLGRAGHAVGAVFAVNTLGTVLGAALTGLVLMPWLGLARTLGLGLGLNAALGILILGRARWLARPVWAWVGTPGLVIAWVLLAGAFDTTWQKTLTLGLWRDTAPPDVKTYREYAHMMRLGYYRDGAGASVCVNQGWQGDDQLLTLRINGKPDAGTGIDVPTQLLLGHLPMFLQPDARQVLVIGLGSGMTGGAALKHPGVEHLEVVELLPEVAAAAPLFAAHNDRVLEDPRVRLVLEDAKSFLQLTDRRYDAIISEPSNPWVAGQAGVFSREYYERCRARLKPGGLMVQWIQAYEIDDRTLEVMLNTLSGVFPVVGVWQPCAADLILVGSAHPRPVSFAEFERRFEQPAVKADLARFGLTRLPLLLAMEILSPENTALVAPPNTRVHSDFYPVLEYLAQRAFFVRTGPSLPAALNEHLSSRPSTLLGQYLKRHPLTEADYEAFVRYEAVHGVPIRRVFGSLLRRWLSEHPATPTPRLLLARAAEPEGAKELEAQRLTHWRTNTVAPDTVDPALLRLQATLLLETYRHQRSSFYRPPVSVLERVLEELVDLDPAQRRVYRLWLAEMAWDRQDDPTCFRLAQMALDPDVALYGPAQFDLDRQAPARLLGRMIETLWRTRRLSEAWNLCQTARQNGYIGQVNSPSDPVTEMIARKIEALAHPSTTPPPGPAAPSSSPQLSNTTSAGNTRESPAIIRP